MQYCLEQLGLAIAFDTCDSNNLTAPH